MLIKKINVLLSLAITNVIGLTHHLLPHPAWTEPMGWRKLHYPLLLKDITFLGMSLIITKSIIQHKFYIDISESIHIFMVLYLISAPH